jgi:D-alanyl-D-alanine dipeptidase
MLLFVLIAQPRPDLVDVQDLEPKILLDIRYATPDNFVGKKVYEEARCLLLRPIAEQMAAAQRWLDRHHPGHRLMMKDCYRPDGVQKIMWDAVRGTPKARYVANPGSKTGSIHSYGAAVDVTLADDGGRELDMGTAYDHLGRLAEPRHEEEYLRTGELSEAQVARRRILRRAMREGGNMRGILNEWWHFNAPEAARNKLVRLDVPFSAYPRKR